MNTLEIAQKYGVPTPETCKELDWKVKTNYSWVEYKDSFVLCFESCIYKLIGVLDNANYSGYKYYKAPQIHEIAPLLPEKILKGGVIHYLEIRANFIQYESDLPFDVFDSLCKVENHHYAEAYAQLYLKLKNENLL